MTLKIIWCWLLKVQKWTSKSYLSLAPVHASLGIRWFGCNNEELYQWAAVDETAKAKQSQQVLCRKRWCVNKRSWCWFSLCVWGSTAVKSSATAFSPQATACPESINWKGKQLIWLDEEKNKNNVKLKRTFHDHWKQNFLLSPDNVSWYKLCNFHPEH